MPVFTLVLKHLRPLYNLQVSSKTMRRISIGNALVPICMLLLMFVTPFAIGKEMEMKLVMQTVKGSFAYFGIASRHPNYVRREHLFICW